LDGTGLCPVKHSDQMDAESFSGEENKITSFQPFMKELPPPQGYFEIIIPIDGKFWNLSVVNNSDEYAEWKGGEGFTWGQWWFCPIVDGERWNDTMDWLSGTNPFGLKT